MEIDKYEALLEKAKDFNNLRNGGIWRIVEELVEAVEDLLEENSFLASGTCVAWEKQAKIEGMREAAKLCLKDDFRGPIGSGPGYWAHRVIMSEVEQIEKDLNNEQQWSSSRMVGCSSSTCRYCYLEYCLLVSLKLGNVSYGISKEY